MALAATDSSLRGINSPLALAKRYLAHRRMLGVRDEADVLSDAMYGIACGVATWREDGGRSLLSWCWLHMDREVDHGRRKRARVMAHEEVATDGVVTEPEWLIARTTDPGYRQVDDRVTLQRWADMAHLTDIQADVIAWMAVHAGTFAKRERFDGPARDRGLMTTKGAYSNLRAGLAKLRRVAATGQPWIRTSTPPRFDLADVRAGVAG